MMNLITDVHGTKKPEWAQTVALRHDPSVQVKKYPRQLPQVSQCQSLIMEEFSESRKSPPVPLLK